MPFAFNMFEPEPWSYEYLAWKGMIHFAAYHQTMEYGIPFDAIYSLNEDSYLINSRYPIRLSMWQNILHIFQPAVWIFLVISS